MEEVFRVELDFTTTYKKYKDSHPAIREVMCLKSMFPNALSPIEKGNYFAGRFISTPGVNKVKGKWNAQKHNIPAIGFLSLIPGDGKSGVGYYCHPDKLRKKLKDVNASTDLSNKIEDLILFWETRNY